MIFLCLLCVLFWLCEVFTISLFNFPEMCNFEYGLGKETCHWTQDKSDDFDWTVNLQPPQVSSTGPHTDHTLRPENSKKTQF